MKKTIAQLRLALTNGSTHHPKALAILDKLEKQFAALETATADIKFELKNILEE